MPGMARPGLHRFLSPGGLLWPPLPSPWAQVDSVAQGCLWCLQWDCLSVGVSTLIWSLGVSGSSSARGRDLSPNTMGRLLKVGVLSAGFGFVGASTVLLWEKDERALSRFKQTRDVHTAGNMARKAR